MRNTDGAWVTIDQEATGWDLKELLENKKAIVVPASFSRLMMFSRLLMRMRNECVDKDDDKRVRQVGVKGAASCGAESPWVERARLPLAGSTKTKSARVCVTCCVCATACYRRLHKTQSK